VAVRAADGVEDVVDAAHDVLDGGGRVVDELVDAQLAQNRSCRVEATAINPGPPGAGQLDQEVPDAPGRRR